MSRLKVLVSAYACSPYQGSEPGVGWGFVSALSRVHDVWVIVEEEKFRSDIERYLDANPSAGSNLHFVFLRKKRNRLLRRVWPPSYYWYYRAWHLDALEAGRKLHDEVSFDVVHQLTMVGFREPGFLWRLGVPFVWGPIGGMGAFPWRFLPRIGVRGALYYCVYNVYNRLQMRLLKRPRAAALAAGAGLISATHETAKLASRAWGVDSVVLSEIGRPPRFAKAPEPRDADSSFRLVWSGLHIPRKALPLALHALAAVPRSINWTLDVLGSGPLTNEWIQMADAAGVGDRVRFLGALDRDAALDCMSGAHAMLITSLRDLTSSVTVEALSLGLPVICPKHCGFADAIDESCGIPVSVESPDALVEAMSTAIIRLATDENLRLQKAQGALVRATRFDWEIKARVVDQIYREVSR